MSVNIKIHIFAKYLICLIPLKLYAEPPAPPQLPSALANQSISQLIALFANGSKQNLNNFIPTLLQTTSKLTSLNTNKPTSTLSKSILSSSSPTTPPESTGEAGSFIKTLDNPNTTIAAKANLMFNTTTNADGTPRKVTQKNQYDMPIASQALNKSFASNFTGDLNLQLPELTFSNSSVTKAYNDFVIALKENPNFLSMFKKIHITTLHQLYQYLIGIYATLNLMNINDLKTYIILEKQFGLNKKTLILSHLVDVIQRQLTQTIKGIMPGMPDQVAIRAGMSALKNQGANNLNMFTLDMEESVLTMLGMNALTEDQVALIIKILNTPENIEIVTNNKNIDQSLYQSALKKMSPSNANFVQELTSDQADALFEALNSISFGITNAQELQSVQNIIEQLNSSNTTRESLSVSDQAYFTDKITEIAYGLPLVETIENTNNIIKKITESSSDPFSNKELSGLKNILAYITSLFEKNLTNMIVQVITLLSRLNPNHLVLSISQKIDLQILSTQLLASKQPLQLLSINQSDKSLLGTGLIILSKNPPTNEIQKISTTLNLVGEQLLRGTLPASISSDQTNAIKQALEYLKLFTFTPTTLRDAEKAFSAADQVVIEKAFSALSDPNFTSFEIFDQPTQGLILDTIQELDAILNTRLRLSVTDAAPLTGLLGDSDETAAYLTSNLSMDDYGSLATLYEYISSKKESVSAADIANTFANQNPAPYESLKKIFSTSSDPETPTYRDYLNGINQQNILGSATQQVVESLSANDLEIYRKFVNKLQNQSFDFSKLDTNEIKLLRSFFEPLKIALTESMNGQENNNTMKLIQKVAILVAQTHAFNNMKASYLWVLKKYLLFFNLYTESLQDYTQSTYQIINGFTQQAKSVAESLKKTSLQTLNPPLFFYDEDCIRTLQMIPQLAQLVNNTSHVPYPTFAVEQALNGSTVNPNDGITYNNTVSMGGGSFVYQKFFFMDTLQKSVSSSNNDITELTGSSAQKISWLKKIAVPVSNNEITTPDGKSIKNYGYIYKTENKPNDISGFYMNIPIFDTDPMNPNTVLIRLFEQQIIAQPDWLNYSGLNKDSSGKIIPGVMTILRGCMGDFMSLLDLNIFDPCLSVMFKTALSIDEPKKISSLSNDVNFNKETKNCGMYLEDKLLAQERMQKTNSVKNTSASASKAGGSMQKGM